jgi:hypothetical protein
VRGWHLDALPALPLPTRGRGGRRRPRSLLPPLLPEVAEAPVRRSEPVMLNVALLALMPALFWFVLHAGLAAPAVTEKGYPAAALRQMDALGLQGNLLNDYKWGGYLLYHAYPARRVFIDGRADAYKAEVLDDYLHVSRLKPGWREVLERYQIRIILWPAEHALTEALKLDPDWELRYSDDVAVLFTRRTPPLPLVSRTQPVR